MAYVVRATDPTGLPSGSSHDLRERPPRLHGSRAFRAPRTLPLTANGKVDRNRSPRPISKRPTHRTPHVGPRTPTEVRIAAIWADALGIASPGVHDNFFDLGGHSLKAAQIVTALRSAFGVDAAMRHLFEQPTIAGLAEIVDILAVSAAGAGTADGSEREEIEI